MNKGPDEFSFILWNTYGCIADILTCDSKKTGELMIAAFPFKEILQLRILAYYYYYWDTEWN